MASVMLMVPLLLVLIINLVPRRLREGIYYSGVLFTLLQTGLVAAYPHLLLVDHASPFLSWFPFTLAVDAISLVMLLSIGIVGCAAFVVGRATIADGDRRFDFNNLLLLGICGMNGLVMVVDAFSLYIFLEIVAVVSFVLIALKGEKDALEGSFKYLVMSAIATALMLTAIAVIFMAAGDTSFAALKSAMHNSPHSVMLNTAMALFLIGIFIKSGTVPFHGWLPDAYSSAPDAASVLLAGIVTKTTGIYTMARLTVSVFGFGPTVKMILLVAGTASILVGAFAALGQKDFKRMLAYSSISQMGYIVVSLGTGTALGLAGAVFHIFNHAVFKSQLFINAAAVESRTGTRNMDELGGVAEKMPLTGLTSVVGFLSTAGIPPFAGFWSKLIIIIALWKAGYAAFAVIAILASLMTLAYFLLMQRRVFFGVVKAGLESVTEAPMGLVVPAVALALVTLAVGLLFPLVLNSIILPVEGIL